MLYYRYIFTKMYPCADLAAVVILMVYCVYYDMYCVIYYKTVSFEGLSMNASVCLKPQKGDLLAAALVFLLAAVLFVFLPEPPP